MKQDYNFDEKDINVKSNVGVFNYCSSTVDYNEIKDIDLKLWNKISERFKIEGTEDFQLVKLKHEKSKTSLKWMEEELIYFESIKNNLLNDSMYNNKFIAILLG